MSSLRQSTWWSLCCGLDATASAAMTVSPSTPRGFWPPVGRMGGKRAYAHGILDLLGDWPRRWVMIDADPAIVLWWSAVFCGWLDEVAERIRTYELDGEALWRSIVYANGKDGSEGPAPVPDDPVGRLAAWLVAQKGNFSAKPVTWNGCAMAGTHTWGGVAGCAAHARSSPQWSDRPELSARLVADAVDKWRGVAGYGAPSEAARAMGFSDRVVTRSLRETVARWTRPSGEAIHADLNAAAPDAVEGDLVTIDPPYEGTTDYGAADLPRSRVVELALLAHAAGARVLVHEREAVLSGGPWRSIPLRRTSGGASRTWAPTPEVVTINFEPASDFPGAFRDRSASRTGMAPISGSLFADPSP